MDQNNPDVATLAMEIRIAMRLMVALLAGDERVTPQTLNQAFTSEDYQIQNGTVTLNWEKFLLKNWTKARDRRKNKDLMKLFSENVQERKSQDFPDMDWTYIDGLAQ